MTILSKSLSKNLVMNLQGRAHLQLLPLSVDRSDFDVHGAIDNDQVWILLYLFACKYDAGYCNYYDLIIYIINC